MSATKKKVLDSVLFEPQCSAVLRGKCVSSNAFGVDDAVFTCLVRVVLFVARSHLDSSRRLHTKHRCHRDADALTCLS